MSDEASSARSPEPDEGWTEMLTTRHGHDWITARGAGWALYDDPETRYPLLVTRPGAVRVIVKAGYESPKPGDAGFFDEAAHDAEAAGGASSDI